MSILNHLVDFSCLFNKVVKCDVKMDSFLAKFYLFCQSKFGDCVEKFFVNFIVSFECNVIDMLGIVRMDDIICEVHGLVPSWLG